MAQTPEERRAYEKAYRADPTNKERKREYDKQYRANWTEEQRQLDKERLKKYNGASAVERVRKWREDNPERTKELRVMAQGRRRSSGERQRFSLEDVVHLYGTKCYICQEEIDLNAPKKCGVDGWRRSLWLDHVISIANGGSHTLENIRPTHGECNLRKGKNNV